MSKNISFLLPALAVFALQGCHHNPVPTDPEPVKVKVTVAQPSATAYSSEIPYSGTVEESTGTTVSFATAGTLNQINVKQGDRISKGQLIGTVDDSSLRHAYDISRSTLNEAQDAYNRFKKLHDAGSLPDMRWVEVENTLSQAVSAEAIARKALGDATLTAPMSGYVSEKFADAGQVVAPGVPVVRIVEIDPVKINVSIPENEISQISVGTAADITVKALNSRHFEGTVVEKGVIANPLTRSYDVKIEVANPDMALLPGMICDVNLEKAPAGADDEASTPATNAFTLPQDAVLVDADNQNFVWMVSCGVADKRIVGVEGITDNGVVVSSGITAGDSVITSGQQKVSRGTPIRVID